ncbi:MAG: thioredoxin [Prevotellaceae bacterium]|nr:thioredoxin [Prevotellaceae bacterium]
MALNITEKIYERLLQNGKPIVIDFWAEWCGPCRRMAPIVEQLADEYKEQAFIGKCNVEESEELATKFMVTSIPTLVFIDSKGQMADRIVGAQSKAAVEERIKKML